MKKIKNISPGQTDSTSPTTAFLAAGLADDKIARVVDDVLPCVRRYDLSSHSSPDSPDSPASPYSSSSPTSPYSSSSSSSLRTKRPRSKADRIAWRSGRSRARPDGLQASPPCTIVLWPLCLAQLGLRAANRKHTVLDKSE